ncbi:MAG: 3-methyladenine DNA glycosylase, partial [Hyphomicrobiales bacterium]
MRHFDEIFEISAGRKGGAEALEEMLDRPKPAAELTAIPDDRWLSQMTRSIFQAGFNWKVVDNMWPGFETVFHGFDVGRCRMLSDEDIDAMVSDSRIIRNGMKIRSVRDNAIFLAELAAEAGSAAQLFGTWPAEDYVDLVLMLKQRGSRLGGNSGPYFLRFMGVDSFILSRDVTARLIAEGVIDKTPSSQKAQRAVQEAFNIWRG